MSTFTTEYVYFYTKNHTGTDATSGYALPITPFQFIPVVVDTENKISSRRLVWDFGDGTQSTDISAKHVYDFPGQYLVTLYLYDSGGNAFFDSFAQTVTVKNWIADTLTLSDIVSGSSHNHEVRASYIEKPFIITRHNSWQTYNTLSAQGYTLNLYASGSNSPFLNFDLFSKSPYAHLLPSARFHINSRNLFSGATEFIAVSSVKTTNDEIYVRLNESNEVVTTVQAHSGSAFAGTSGSREVFYTDDFPTISGGGSAIVSVMFDLQEFDDQESWNSGVYKYVKRPEQAYLNQVPETIQYTFTSQTSSHKLVITTNGIDGRGEEIDTFNIDVNQFQENRIPFTVRIKDVFNYPTKYISQLSAVPLTATLVNNTVKVAILTGTGLVSETLYDIEPDMYSLTGESLSGGFWKGYIIPHFSTTENVTLSALANVDLNFYSVSSLSSEVVVGSSNTFNIWSDNGKYNIGKVNEDVNYQQKFKDLRFQESLADTDRFFDDFIGTIVGALTSSPNTLGKRTHEKISNFVTNIRSPDTCNVNALFSLAEEVGLDLAEFERNKFTSPPDFARIIDILSIKQSKLWGERNQFKENFNDIGNCESAYYGNNLGTELDIATAVLTAGGSYGDIVLYEIFSREYRTVSSDLLSSTFVDFRNITNQSYELSSYNTHWGWGLALPAGVSGLEIKEYYKFYNFVDTAEGTQLEGMINWSDALTTVVETVSTRNEWFGDGQVMDNILTYELFKGLRLFTSASDIEY